MTTAQSDKDKDFYTNRCDGLPRDGVLRGLDRCPSPAEVIDFQPSAFSLQHCLFGALTPAEIKIVEGALQ
jgi:hypothetical protein